MTFISYQRGAAIIVALFVTALVAVIAIAMIERFRIDVRRTELILNDTQAYLYAEGSVAWAMEQLNTNLRKKKPDNITDILPIHSAIDTVENAQVSSVIDDQENLFNINNLADLETQTGFIQLVKTVAPTMNVDEIKDLITAIRDWISSIGTQPQLDNYYAKQTPAYVAPHRPMASISELRLIKGMTPKLYTQLSPYVTALPETTYINVNNAPAQVLMSLSPTLSLEAANSIINYRQQHPFTTPESFLNFDVVKNNPITAKQISVISSYFLVKTNVKIYNQEIALYTLLHRVLKNAKPMEIIVWQSKGTL